MQPKKEENWKLCTIFYFSNNGGFIGKMHPNYCWWCILYTLYYMEFYRKICWLANALNITGGKWKAHIVCQYTDKKDCDKKVDYMIIFLNARSWQTRVMRSPLLFSRPVMCSLFHLLFHPIMWNKLWIRDRDTRYIYKQSIFFWTQFSPFLYLLYRTYTHKRRIIKNKFCHQLITLIQRWTACSVLSFVCYNEMQNLSNYV